VADINQRGKRAIFVGGTPMFLKAILRGFDPGPPADWKFREAVEADTQRYGVDALRERLRQVDPVAAHRIGTNDVRRMIRALEVARFTGQPLTHRQLQFDRTRSPEECLVFAMQVPRGQLHARINARVDAMFDMGLVDEVQGLLERYAALSRTASQGVGYRELIAYFEQGGDVATVRKEIATHTRQLAKRQETWFRSFSEIRPVPAADPINAASIAKHLAGLIHQAQ
jgi:tRNA dimethylallyltransferase